MSGNINEWSNDDVINWIKKKKKFDMFKIYASERKMTGKDLLDLKEEDYAKFNYIDRKTYGQLLKKVEDLSKSKGSVKKTSSFAWPRKGNKDGYDSGVDTQDSGSKRRGDSDNSSINTSGGTSFGDLSGGSIHKQRQINIPDYDTGERREGGVREVQYVCPDEVFSRRPNSAVEMSPHLPLSGLEDHQNEYDTGSLSTPQPVPSPDYDARYDVGVTAASPRVTPVTDCVTDALESASGEGRSGSFTQRRPPLPPPNVKSYRDELNEMISKESQSSRLPPSRRPPPTPNIEVAFNPYPVGCEPGSNMGDYMNQEQAQSQVYMNQSQEEPTAIYDNMENNTHQEDNSEESDSNDEWTSSSPCYMNTESAQALGSHRHDSVDEESDVDQVEITRRLTLAMKMLDNKDNNIPVRPPLDPPAAPKFLKESRAELHPPKFSTSPPPEPPVRPPGLSLDSPPTPFKPPSISPKPIKLHFDKPAVKPSNLPVKPSRAPPKLDHTSVVSTSIVSTADVAINSVPEGKTGNVKSRKALFDNLEAKSIAKELIKPLRPRKSSGLEGKSSIGELGKKLEGMFEKRNSSINMAVPANDSGKCYTDVEIQLPTSKPPQLPSTQPPSDVLPSFRPPLNPPPLIASFPPGAAGSRNQGYQPLVNEEVDDDQLYDLEPDEVYNDEDVSQWFPGFFPDVKQREEANRLLLRDPNRDCFLVRNSDKEAAYPHVISIKINNDAKGIQHTRVGLRKNGTYAIGREKVDEKTHATLGALVSYHSVHPLCLNNQTIILKNPVRRS